MMGNDRHLLSEERVLQLYSSKHLSERLYIILFNLGRMMMIFTYIARLINKIISNLQQLNIKHNIFLKQDYVFFANNNHPTNKTSLKLYLQKFLAENALIGVMS